MTASRITELRIYRVLAGFFRRLITPSRILPSDGLRYWQEQILQAILLTALILGFFAYIPSFGLSLYEGLWGVAFIDTLIYILVILLYRGRMISYRSRAIILVSLCYILGLVLLIALGPFGGGPIWIFTVPVLTAVLLGFRGALFSLFVNAVTLVIIGLMIFFHTMGWNEAAENAMLKWVVISSNFMLLNVIATLSVTTILKSLEQALTDQKEAMTELARHQKEIKRTNRKLQEEIKEHAKAEDAKKYLESQLRQAQKMEAVGTLAGGIAHDFNNILYTIMGFTELTIDELEPDSSSHRNLRRVMEAARRARDLVRQILTFSRQAESNSQPVYVKPIIKEALKMLRATLPTSISMQSDIRSDAYIQGDPTSIHQILMNLATNAAHAMQPGGGTLRVELEDAEIDREAAGRHPDLNPGSYLIIRINDSGHGISPSELEKIFDPFYTTKEPGEGTGMGLSVVHGIVTNHGGAISVNSEKGKGSEFSVYLPAMENLQNQQAGRIASPPPTGSERILFIDDEAAIAEMAKQMLQTLGYLVSTETNSIQALERFKQAPEGFDLVITDMTMPGFTGDQLAAELLSVRKDVPVILCTGYSSMVSEESIKAQGIAALCMKPLVRQDLAVTVRRVLDSLPAEKAGEEST
jgi:signal transduction histidine kinase/ActR/RegA family two-component response regulator